MAKTLAEVQAEQELYNEFFLWLDSLTTIIIPDVGSMPARTFKLSDLMCEGMIGHYTDDLYDEWLKERNHATGN